MLHSTDYRELKNGKRYKTSDEREMSYHGSTEELVNRSSSENVEEEVRKFKRHKRQSPSRLEGLLLRQLVELTRLVQRMSTPMHPNSYPRNGLGTISGTAMPQSDRRFHLLLKWRKNTQFLSRFIVIVASPISARCKMLLDVTNKMEKKKSKLKNKN